MIDKPDSNEEAQWAATQEKKPARNRLSQGIRFALSLSLLALFFTAAGIASGYKHWQRMNDKTRDNQTELAELRQQVGTLPERTELETLRQEVLNRTRQDTTSTTEALQEMARLQNQTRQFADTVAAQVEQITLLQARLQNSVTPPPAQDWQIAQVEFLLQLAIRELHLGQDATTAQAALKEADALLARLGSINYLPVRQQITRDLTALQGFVVPDISTLSQQIRTLMLELQPLPSPAPQAGEPANSAAGSSQSAERQPAASVWENYKRQAIEALDKAVVIRELDQPIRLELDSTLQQHLYQLLHLRLENLRLLALQHLDKEYHAQIESIRILMLTYYTEDLAKPLLADLEKLDQYQLQPVLPDISGSLRQLEKARQADVHNTQQSGKEEEKAEKTPSGPDKEKQPETTKRSHQP